MLAPIAPVLSAADVAVVNLETAVTDRGRAASKEYNFRAPPSALDALRGGGVDVVTVANNHGLDYGARASATRSPPGREHRFPVVGIGTNATQAYAPYRATIHGQRIAVFGATQVIDDHLIASWTRRTPGSRGSRPRSEGRASSRR